MDGYPSTPLNLSDGTTVTQAGGGEDETDDEKPFAQAGDLEARWHALTGEEYKRAEALLADASDLIRTTCPRWPAANARHIEAHRLHGRQTSHRRPARPCRASPNPPRPPAATAKA